jgi:hypothetical protein
MRPKSSLALSLNKIALLVISTEKAQSAVAQTTPYLKPVRPQPPGSKHYGSKRKKS